VICAPAQIYPSGVLWTLTVELTFYAAIPLFAIARSRAAQTFLVALATVASFAYQKYLGAEISSMDNWPISVPARGRATAFGPRIAGCAPFAIELSRCENGPAN
jgi:peptidoglycan/LPS O-acetylase OafA/YrhL